LQELELASALVQVLAITRGYDATETLETAARAYALAEEGGNLAQLVQQGFWAWAARETAGDHSGAGPLADQLLNLAEREGSATSLALAHHAQLQMRFYRGDLLGAEEHFIRWGRYRKAVDYKRVSGASVWPMGFASVGAWIAGHADLARERIAQMISTSLENRNPFDLGWARCFERMCCNLVGNGW
jgi:hypothetical protein